MIDTGTPVKWTEAPTSFFAPTSGGTTYRGRTVTRPARTFVGVVRSVENGTATVQIEGGMTKALPLASLRIA